MRMDMRSAKFGIGQVVKSNDLNYPAGWRLSKKGRESNEA